MDSTYLDRFAAELDDRLSVPPDARPAAREVYDAWHAQEDGRGIGAENNPFNTTWSHEQGATWYNSFGPGGTEHVRNYPTLTEGVDATAQTLLTAHGRYGYGAIVFALRSGNADAAARAIDASSWGTHGVAQALGHDAQPTADHSQARRNVAALQGFLDAHGHAPAHSRTATGWDGIVGPGTEDALASFVHGGRDNVAALQGFLADEGHAPEHSRRSDGSWDGIAGPGTSAALHAFIGR